MGLRASYDALSRMAVTLSATLAAIRQQRGNSKGIPLGAMSAADSATRLHPVAESVAENKVHGLVTDGIGLPEPYRYGDSNPGFRTENPAS